jgi:formate dehydrogenase major subunit
VKQPLPWAEVLIAKGFPDDARDDRTRRGRQNTGGLMSRIRLSIDNREVEAEEGTTVLRAAREAGIEIPSLCDDEDLSHAAGCRLCVVEVEGSRNLVASCAYPVAPNMVVRTGSDRVLAARKLTVELLLSDHPANCMVCEKSGDCKLESLAYSMGISATRFEGERHHYPVDESNPFIVRDYNKCVLCQRCIRACEEIQGNSAIDYAYRGFHTKVSVAFDRGLEGSDCVFCGQCVAVCPTGALAEKKAKGLARTWETAKVRTTCPYCGVGCQLWLHVKNERITKVTAVRDAQPNRGRLCVKGRFGYDFIYSEDRLKTPLIRTESGQFRAASWDEALDLTAAKFKEIIAKDGPDAIGGVSCARSINEDSYQMQKLFRSVIGTNNIDHCART